MIKKTDTSAPPLLLSISSSLSLVTCTHGDESHTISNRPTPTSSQ